MRSPELFLAACALTAACSCLADSSGDSRSAKLKERLNDVIALLEEKALVMDTDLMAGQAADALLKAADPGGAILSEEDLQELHRRQNGLVFSAGITLAFGSDTVAVKEILPDSPAARAGLQTNDVLLSINEQALDGLIPPETISLLRGTAPRNTTLKILRNDQPETISFPLTALQLPAVEVIEYFPENLVYVMVNGLFPEAGTALSALMMEWKEQKIFGAIFDLRNAAGRDAESVKRIADTLAAPHIRLYGYQDSNGHWLEEMFSDDGERLALPVMILVNEKTSEASELLAAVCKNALKGCMVLGTETAASPMIREALPLPDGRKMLLATRMLAAGEKGRYNGTRGVQPDITVSDSWYSETYEPAAQNTTLDEEKEDKVLRERLRGDGPLSRATDLLLGLKALNIQPGEKP